MVEKHVIRIDGNDLILCEYTADQGPYRAVAYGKLVNADLTGTADAAEILGSEFVTYLDRYFVGWRLLCLVEEHPGRYRGGGHYKVVRYVLRFQTDADALTAMSRLRKVDYSLDCLRRRQ